MSELLKIESWDTDKPIPYDRNPRVISEEAIAQVANSISEVGFRQPIVVNKNGIIIVGHTRQLAAKKLELKKVPVHVADLTPEQEKAYRIRDNKSGEYSTWDVDLLQVDFEVEDLFEMGFKAEDLETTAGGGEEPPPEEKDQEGPLLQPPKTIVTKPGDVWTLGNHRLVCGDATSPDDVAKLMGDELADTVFTDPPYGMKKEGEGIVNDNLNQEKLLDFNRQWIPNSFAHCKENASWYCWGEDEPLMEIYSHIIKPYIKEDKATFKNLITWDKNTGIGQKSKDMRCYARADEKCLFIMLGVQEYDNNSSNYFEGFEPIRLYMRGERDKMGWPNIKVGEFLDVSPRMADHWFSKSQFCFPKKEQYEVMQKEADGKAFNKSYEELKNQHNDIMCEYAKVKDAYYDTRAYFDNVHDNMNSIWHFERTTPTERKQSANFPTPKPMMLCVRGVKTSCPEGGTVQDLFGGGGSTLMAAQHTGRKAYVLEIKPVTCDLIITRWQNQTGSEAVHESGKTFLELAAEE